MFSAEKDSISLFKEVLSRGKQEVNFATSHLVVRALLLDVRDSSLPLQDWICFQSLTITK